jgi:hypothetical protein
LPTLDPASTQAPHRDAGRQPAAEPGDAAPVKRPPNAIDDSPRMLRQRKAIESAFGADNTGLPPSLRAGIESLSGVDMSEVRVHRNSSAPARIDAAAYAQGRDIHLGPGQEHVLPHEAWHVVQQAEGRVSPTRTMRQSLLVNDELALEAEADRMGRQAAQLKTDDRGAGLRRLQLSSGAAEVVQGDFYSEAKVGLELTFHNAATKRWTNNFGIADRHDLVARQWSDVLEDWKDHAESNPIVGVTLRVDESLTNKDYGNETGLLPNSRFIYTGTNSGQEIFWWNLSLDPSVIEIQTSPATGTDFNAGTDIEQIVQNHIFGGANAQGLQTGQGIGGGHINVDFQTGYGSDLSLVPHLIAATDQMYTEVHRQGGSPMSSPEAQKKLALFDIPNLTKDPLLSSSRVTDKDDTGKDHAGSWHQKFLDPGKYNSAKKFAAFRKEHAEWLINHRTVGQQDLVTDNVASESNLGHALHHQAVNIDHVQDNDPAKRRIEYRFFEGQGSVDDIRDGIRMLSEIKGKALNSNRK